MMSALRPHQRRALLWGLAFTLTIISQVYLLPKVIDVSDGQDFRLIWLAGEVWMSGENPYSEDFNLTYLVHFGSQRASHFWVYPPYWYTVSTALNQLEFREAVLIWNLVSYAALWGGAISLVSALEAVGYRVGMPSVLIIGSIASLLQATPFSIALGQTSLLLFIGVSLFIVGSLREKLLFVVIGLLLAMLKPQVGVLLLTFSVVNRRLQPAAVLVLAILSVASLPAIYVGGFIETVFGFIENIISYNASDAVANLPEHLLGVQKMLSIANFDVSSLILILISVFLIAIAKFFYKDGPQTLHITILLALLGSGLHTYDLTIIICLIPFIVLYGWRVVFYIVGFLLIVRAGNLASVLSIPAFDSEIFPGSIHATLGLVLFTIAGLGVRTDSYFMTKT